MARFLIEVPHEDNKDACERAINTFMASGSHFLTHADWGCYDGAHKAWLLVEMDSREEAKLILPSLFRENARIVELKRFNREAANESAQSHSS